MENNANFLDLKVERETFLIKLNESRKAEELTDLKLQMGDKLFPAHRAVLFHSSPVLKALISERWSTTNVCPIGDQYVDVEIMEDLLSFFYTGKIQLTLENVHSVCMAAHFLHIPTLLEPSLKYLCQFITIDNVLTLFKFSTVCELEELNYACLKLVNNNHENVLESPQILELSSKDFKDFIVGLQKLWNKILRENTFHCIARWTETDLSGRLEELPELLKNIPLEELPPKFLTETVSNHPLVKDSISAIETVSAALANYRTYSTYSTPLWKTNQNMIVIGGPDARALRLYDSRSGLWKKLPDMPSERTNFGVTVANHQNIILCGGFINRHARHVACSSVIMFDWSTQTWTELPEMPLECGTASAAICNDHLYVVGDFSDAEERSAHSKKVLRFSFKTKQWEFVASTNRKHRRYLIEHKSYLYAFSSNGIEKYDPTQDKWTIMKKKTECGVFYLTIHQHKMFIYDLNCLIAYHPETNSLDYFPTPPFGLSSLVSLNGKLLAVGGLRNVKNTDLIFEFDFPTGKWIEFGKVNANLVCNSSVVGAFY